MSDQTDSRVGSEDKTASQAAPSQTQSGETQQGNSLAGDALADLALKDPVAVEKLRRNFQSEKDKGVEKAKKALDEVQIIAQTLGISPEKVEEVRRNRILDGLYEQQYGNSQAEVGGQKPAETQPTASSVDLPRIKMAYSDIDFNDPKVLQAYQANANNEDGFLAALGKIKISNTNKPQPTAASVSSPAGSAVKPTNVADALADVNAILSDRDALMTKEGRERLKAARMVLQEKEQQA